MNRLSRAHKRYRLQTTDGRAIAYSEREREFTFAKNDDAAAADDDDDDDDDPVSSVSLGGTSLQQRSVVGRLMLRTASVVRQPAVFRPHDDQHC